MDILTRAATERLAEIESLDAKIRAIAPTIDPNEIRPQRRQQNRYSWEPRDESQPPIRHGDFTRSLLRCLRDSPEGVRTKALVEASAHALGVSLGTVQRRAVHTDRVTRRLRELTRRGFVVRLHRPDSATEGIWRLATNGSGHSAASTEQQLVTPLVPVPIPAPIARDASTEDAGNEVS